MVQGNYLCTRTYDIDRSFEVIFKITCLMRVLFLKTIVSIEPPIWGKMCPQNWFFGFHSAGMEFFEEKTYKQYLVPHSPQKRFNSFLSSNTSLPEKWSCPPKIIFRCYFGKYVFLIKNCSMEKYLKPDFLQKRLY